MLDDVNRILSSLRIESTVYRNLIAPENQKLQLSIFTSIEYFVTQPVRYSSLCINDNYSSNSSNSSNSNMSTGSDTTTKP